MCLTIEEEIRRMKGIDGNVIFDDGANHDIEESLEIHDFEPTKL